MLEQIWALIEKDPGSETCTVLFIMDNSGVFDRIRFPSAEEASHALRRNGFSPFGEDKEDQIFVVTPVPPFFEDCHPNGPIYSSGRFWR